MRAVLALGLIALAAAGCGPVGTAQPPPGLAAGAARAARGPAAPPAGALRCEAARWGGGGLWISLRFAERQAVVTPYGRVGGQRSVWGLSWTDQLYTLDRSGRGGTFRLAIDRATGRGALISPPFPRGTVVPVACR